MAAIKKVLVLLGPYSRVVELTGDAQLFGAIRNTFNDLPCIKNGTGTLHIKIKNEEWHGEFIDMLQEQFIPDRAVLQVTILPSTTVEEVCIKC